ncbi:hypothetical protein PAXRUDRAFT_834231 [Paxillus rubicundulus Ve08.2h10]|uniref:Uncharacterized protein n=1 Tax=Paxillus rubicundulus Ve08.2h10 TaxID=930991 RepID=A0A0D0C894_9AGAM|nr:hypothetical protein PAXRUDRAFT_834231 [Paxillus rubicundulus Ve08.2h10]
MWYPTRFCLFLTFLSMVSISRSQCTLKIPQNPLTAQGLATPYELTGCNQLDFSDQGVFVEAAILDPATGSIQIYNPLVINAGMVSAEQSQNGTSTPSTTPTSTIAPTSTNSSKSHVSMTSSKSSASTTISTSSMSHASTTSSTPAKSPTSTTSFTSSKEAAATLSARQASTNAGFFVPPIVPTLPNGAIVGLWFGSNANSVILTGATGGCVNGLDDSVFGQFAYCNGQAWFSAAKAAVQQGLIKIPTPGTGLSGQACPVTRDFRIVDQDQSDNVVTTYLMIGNDTLAQNTPMEAQANPHADVLSNASDNALLNEFIQPALGCIPYQNPCTTCPSGQSPALATNELQSNFFPPASGPALVPLNDPMVLVNGQKSLQKVNLYRDGTGQPQADNNNASGLTYCQQFAQSGLFISSNEQTFTNTGSPAADQATNLFTFLAMRFSASFGPAPGLACTQLLNVAKPVNLTTDGNDVVTAATINTQVLKQILSGLTITTTAVQTSSAGTASTSASYSGVRLETSHHKTHTHSSSAATGGTSVPTNPTGTATPTNPRAGSGPAAVPTITVTVTATVCPSQSWSPHSTWWHSGSRSGGGWAAPNGNHKRSLPLGVRDRMQRKSRQSPNW